MGPIYNALWTAMFVHATQRAPSAVPAMKVTVDVLIMFFQESEFDLDDSLLEVEVAAGGAVVYSDPSVT